MIARIARHAGSARVACGFCFRRSLGGLSVLRADGLKVDPLPPLSFSVAKGECLAVEGPSGSGKTRVLRALADLDPAPGQVFLDGAERNEMPAPAWRSRVRYASAEPAWWSATARAAFASDDSANAARCERLLRSLAINTSLLDTPLARLSTGERQRLALVRAMVDEPDALLLDEPTIGLDAQAAALVEELIRFQTLSGRIVLLASHDGGQIGRLAHVRLQLTRPQPRKGAGLP
jgi:ABC-type multidrug transport system ATPase subunit